jgi:putative aminopeptidase FrvX
MIMANPLKIRSPHIRLLESLCAASAISGQEGEVRGIVRKQLEGQADEIREDALGNLLVTKKGKGRNRLRVMLAAHMDEVGLIITQDDKDGIYRFATVGGLDVRQLIGKSVVAGKDHLPGVIGFKPIHLTSPSERSSNPSLDSLRIDLGGDSSKVKLGQRVTFSPNFKQLGSGNARSLFSKALDDRIGVASLIELVRSAPPNVDLLAAFTTQEEIGVRGAQVAAYSLDPDIALVIDCTPAYDLPHWEGEENSHYNARLGAGPAIYTADKRTLSDPRLIRFVTETAREAGIPHQFRQPGGGGTDAGAIHKARAGVPSVSISVPGRYLHTAASLVRLADWQHLLNLIHAVVSNVRPALLKSDRR